MPGTHVINIFMFKITDGTNNLVLGLSRLQLTLYKLECLSLPVTSTLIEFYRAKLGAQL